MTDEEPCGFTCRERSHAFALRLTRFLLLIGVVGSVLLLSALVATLAGMVPVLRVKRREGEAMERDPVSA